jgi:hypothetical protein
MPSCFTGSLGGPRDLLTAIWECQIASSTLAEQQEDNKTEMDVYGEEMKLSRGRRIKEGVKVKHGLRIKSG